MKRRWPTLRRALELRPDYGTAINLIAATLLDMGRLSEAIDTYRQGLALNQDGGFSTYSNLLLTLNYQAGATPGALLAEARAFGEKAACRAIAVGSA